MQKLEVRLQLVGILKINEVNKIRSGSVHLALYSALIAPAPNASQPRFTVQRSPRVLNEPVRLTVLRAPSNDFYGMLAQVPLVLQRFAVDA